MTPLPSEQAASAQTLPYSNQLPHNFLPDSSLSLAESTISALESRSNPGVSSLSDKMEEILNKTACGFSYLEILTLVRGQVIEINEQETSFAIALALIERSTSLKDEYYNLRAQETLIDDFCALFGRKHESRDYIRSKFPMADAVLEMKNAELIGEELSPITVNSMASPGLSYAFKYWVIGISDLGEAIVKRLSGIEPLERK